MENEIKQSGFVLINKIVGPTSHDVIDQLRKITGIKKIGHAGTLDPFASGLLIVAIGRAATKEISKYVKLDKEYIADIHLGAKSDTYDRTGIIENISDEVISKDKIESVLKEFVGEQEQTPPMYSAKKVGGKKLYELARAGKTIERVPCKINIFYIELVNYSWPLLKIKTKCSSGTYIRSLAYDIGETLGCGAYLEELERISIGEYYLNDSKKVGELNGATYARYLF